MDLKKLKELMTAMNRHCIDRVYIKNDQMEVELEKRAPIDAVNPSSSFSPFCQLDEEQEKKLDSALAKTSQAKIPAHAKALSKEYLQNGSNGKIVRSPIVGTFYSSPSPEMSSFVKVGDFVQKDTVVCIIEAMKVMNEIKAGAEGRVKEIFLENSSPVEYGSPLVCIES